MTDNEIIKAFKDFLIEQVDGYTDHVETGGERYKFIEKELELLKETDNLINRQQAEIERLVKEVDRLSQCVLYHDGQAVDAVKEFAEKAVEKVEKVRQKYQRLCKEQGEEMEEHMHIHFNGIIGIINNLLKETVGENNA